MQQREAVQVGRQAVLMKSCMLSHMLPQCFCYACSFAVRQFNELPLMHLQDSSLPPSCSSPLYCPASSVSLLRPYPAAPAALAAAAATLPDCLPVWWHSRGGGHGGVWHGRGQAGPGRSAAHMPATQPGGVRAAGEAVGMRTAC
jgi:hypothetical protein